MRSGDQQILIGGKSIVNRRIVMTTLTTAISVSACIASISALTAAPNPVEPPIIADAVPLMTPLYTNQRLENYSKNIAMPVSQVLQQMADKKMDKQKPKLIFLTIDDGPSRITPKVLDVLRKYHVRATFFVIGSQISGNEAILRRIWDEGHAIANHSYAHKYSGPSKHFLEEFIKTDRLLIKALMPRTEQFCTGVIRIPGGSFGKPALRKAFTTGNYIGIDWNASGADTTKKCLAAKYIAANVKMWANKRQCLVVLDHDSAPKKSLPTALAWIIPNYQARGYQFGTLCSDRSWNQASAAGLVPQQGIHKLASQGSVTAKP